MERTIIKVLKNMAIRTTRIKVIKEIETIIHFLLYNITMLNATNATIMVINPVNVDYQNIP
jgi:hypothetical protein